MTYYVGTMPVGEHLSHHGIKGMKWGQRRYQNPDGSLTAAGRARYGSYMSRASRASGMAAANRRAAGQSKSRLMKSIYGVNERYYTRRANKLTAKANRVKSAGGRKANSNRKRNLKRAAAVVGTAAAIAGTAYLGKKYGKQGLRAAKRLGRAAPFKARAVGNKARTMYAKSVVNARHFGKSAKNSVRSGFGNVKRAASKANFNSAMRKQAKATARANAASTLSRYGSFRNKLNRGINNTNDFFKGTRGAIKRRAKSVGGAVGSAARGVGYKARRAGAKATNTARNLGYMAGNVKGNVKRAASKAGTAAKNAAYKAGSKAKTTTARAKNTAKNIPGNAKRVASNLKNNKAYRYAAIARGVNVAGKAGMGALYYGHARKRGASKGAAAGIGTARAVGGMRAGQLAGAAYTGYKVAKAYNSPSAKAYRKRQRAKKKSRK